ncbi:uncharacterized protein LOC126997562 [Eriocheir sinensis]|uniref:uncharacterized protein LOC126997562 n=1 Tax=Eriocheir sinensis TaxID=95602 RepID=UPI0021C68F59|nr:uncharacterized protein LOC126997562 [Eriocheir sinensis]
MKMPRTLSPALVLLAALVAVTAAQGFYSQRYGKRGADTRQVTERSGFYANRYGRSQGVPEIKVRSSRFVGGSRYGKRSGVPALSEVPVPVGVESEEGELGAPLLVGESVVCLLVDVPDLYRCLKKPASEESTN